MRSDGNRKGRPIDKSLENEGVIQEELEHKSRLKPYRN